ncbi:DUF1615 domain-containing protein [Variovorax sp. PvP013]|uniref:DUF1615 domain-containing protein n=1 Tax=Variovorax sp. PvP013 TaxID=3156435 RepID=UPI003D1BFD27
MRLTHTLILLLAASSLFLAGCGTAPSSASARPEDVRARIAKLLPQNVVDRPGWAVDLYAAFDALRIEPSLDNVCAVLAVAEQESNYRADPMVPGLGRIAREEIDRRAERAGLPQVLVSAALRLRSPDSRTWSERIDAARSEKELSDLFQDFVSQVPLGQRLLAGYNPVRTGGPMQVSVEFAEQHVKDRDYPYRTTGSVRDEVFSRRGGVYFGTAHLLGHPAPYDQMLYRFADFNAGQYASRNAAFQSAVSALAGVSLDLDGDLVVPGGDPAKVGGTEAAVRSIGPRLGVSDGEIRRSLEQADQPSLEQTRLWARVFELAEAQARRLVPRAVLPRIRLQSPKITRKLTTEWFARRVDERYQRCRGRAG